MKQGKAGSPRHLFWAAVTMTTSLSCTITEKPVEVEVSGTTDCGAPGYRGHEICDGLDNDCDGWVDAYFSGSELVHACECTHQRIAFSNAEAFSASTCPVDEDPPLCTMEPATSSAPAGAGSLVLQGCLRCDGTSFALCTNDALVDMGVFDANSDSSALLDVNFSVESSGPLRAAVNLWYEGDEVKAGLPRPRKYLPLLMAGEAPGDHSRRFAPESACFPKWLDETYGCHGERQEAECGHCSAGDTCGRGTVACSDLRYTHAKLQLALEFCWAEEDFQATIRLRKTELSSLGCIPTKADPASNP